VTTTVLIVDDQPLQRLGFRMLLDSNDSTTVVGEAGSGAEAIRQAAALSPDIVLMDIRMPGTDGIEATRRILATGNRSRVIALTTFDLDEYAYSALRAGASGFLLKDTLPADLITAIRVVAAGEALLAPSITRRLISEFARIPPLGTAGPVASSLPTVAGATSPSGGGSRLSGGAAGLPSWASRSSAEATSPRADQVTALLTDREREVLCLVAAGLSNAEIAHRLRISPATAKTHVAHLLTKLDARDRVQLVIIAYQAGLTGC
jgi:DNA-binding NarL/FixJ family response regulator